MRLVQVGAARWSHGPSPPAAGSEPPHEAETDGWSSREDDVQLQKHKHDDGQRSGGQHDVYDDQRRRL